MVAEEDESRAMIVFICEGEPGALRLIGDVWFEDLSAFECSVAGDGWRVEWLPEGSLGSPA